MTMRRRKTSAPSFETTWTGCIYWRWSWLATNSWLRNASWQHSIHAQKKTAYSRSRLCLEQKKYFQECDQNRVTGVVQLIPSPFGCASGLRLPSPPELPVRPKRVSCEKQRVVNRFECGLQIRPYLEKK